MSCLSLFVAITLSYQSKAHAHGCLTKKGDPTRRPSRSPVAPPPPPTPLLHIPLPPPAPSLALPFLANSHSYFQVPSWGSPPSLQVLSPPSGLPQHPARGSRTDPRALWVPHHPVSPSKEGKALGLSPVPRRCPGHAGCTAWLHENALAASPA